MQSDEFWHILHPWKYPHNQRVSVSISSLAPHCNLSHLPTTHPTIICFITIDLFLFSRVLYSTWNQNLSFFFVVWLLSLSVIFLRFIYVVAWITGALLFLVMDIQIVSSVLLLQTKWLWTFTCVCLCRHVLPVPLGKYLGLRRLGSM